MRSLIAGLLLVALAAPAAWAADPSAQLVEGRDRYLRGDYPTAIEKLEPLLYPKALLPSEKEIVEAHFYLGASCFWADRHEEARREFVSLLSLDPSYELDPATEAADLYVFFQRIKSDLREQLEEIKRQRALEEQRKQQEIEERIRAASRKASRRVTIERTIHESPRWLNFVPFGVPQLQRGQKGAGVLFLSTQAVGGAVSLGAFGYAILEHGGWPMDYPKTAAEANEINTLWYVQASGAFLFWASYIGQVVHAFANQPPAVTEKTRDEPLFSRFRLTPTAGDGTVGMGLQWEF